MTITRSLATVTLLFCALAQGCLGSNVYYVDSRFSPEEEAEIKAASTMWNEATGGAMDLPLVFGARVDVTEQERNAIVKVGARAAFNRFPQMASDTRPAFFSRGTAFESSIIVVIGDHVEGDLLRPVVAHEIGHAFGLQHVEEIGALMYKNLHGDVGKCVTEIDLREARRHVLFEDEHPCSMRKY